MSTHATIALGIAATFVVVAASCVFPEIGFKSDSTGRGGAGGTTSTASTSSSSSATTGGAGGTTSTSSTSASGTTSTGGTGTGGTGTETGTGTGTGTETGTATGTETGTGTGTGTGTCADPCDCDGDGDRANTPACGGGDCKDDDPLVNSKQGGWFTQPGSNGWDYNCDGAFTWQHTAFLDCGPLTVCDKSAEKWTNGQSLPDCGKEGTYGTCGGIPVIACSEAAKGKRLQGCH